VKIYAEFENDKDPKYRLRSGTTTTMVIKPSFKQEK
jgi:hypothetical protein